MEGVLCVCIASFCLCCVLGKRVINYDLLKMKWSCIPFTFAIFVCFLTVSICVWACLKESTRHCYFNFYYEYKMRLSWTVLLSGASVLWCCAPSCGNSVGWCVDIKACVTKHLKSCIYLKGQSVIYVNKMTALAANFKARDSNPTITPKLIDMPLHTPTDTFSDANG